MKGERFGRLTVISRDTTRKGVAWLCDCDCGNTTTVYSGNLVKGLTKSCGCLRSEMTSKRSLSDLTNRRFGRLKAIERTIGGRWICKCDCGESVIVEASNLTTGHTRSCGCYKDERRIESHTTHGGSHDRLHRIWSHIKTRCFNTNSKPYRWYGGSGITMCDEWRNDYSAFREWALSHGYDSDLTIDRIDNDGNYEPNNCQWITASENSKKSQRQRRERDV